MKKALQITSLIIKTTLEFIFVCTILLGIGAAVFIIAYTHYSIRNALDSYQAQKETN